MNALISRAFSGALLLIALSGCVVVGGTPAHQSWPKAIHATTLNQFDGVYRNQSNDNVSGKPTNHNTQLFEVLTGRSNDDTRGQQIQLRSSSNGGIIRLRLLDAQGRFVDSAELRRGVDFRLAGGSITVGGPSTGFQGDLDLEIALKHSRAHLYLSATGGLLGAESNDGAALELYIVPVVGHDTKWSYWPRLGQ